MISTMQPRTQSGAAPGIGFALNVAEERKMLAHSTECSAAEVTFVPLVAESLVDWGEGSVRQIARIGCLVGQTLGIPPAEPEKHSASFNLPLERQLQPVGSQLIKT